MRRAINTFNTCNTRSSKLIRLAPFNTVRMLSTTNIVNSNPPVNFDGYFKTFKNVYAPSAKSILGDWQKGYPLTSENINALIINLARIRGRDNFPIPHNVKIDDPMNGYIKEIYRLSNNLNFAFTWFSEGGIVSSSSKSNSNIDPSEVDNRKAKLFQHSLFNVATAVEMELFGYDSMKPGRLVSNCFWPEEFYGKDVVQEFRDRHGGLFTADEKNLISDNVDQLNIGKLNNVGKLANFLGIRCTASEISFEVLFDILTKFYAPRLWTVQAVPYLINRFYTIAQFLNNLGNSKRILNNTAVHYYARILVNLTSDINDAMIGPEVYEPSGRYSISSTHRDAMAFLYCMRHVVECINLKIFGGRYDRELKESFDNMWYNWDKFDDEVKMEFISKVNEGCKQYR